MYVIVFYLQDWKKSVILIYINLGFINVNALTECDNRQKEEKTNSDQMS